MTSYRSYCEARISETYEGLDVKFSDFKVGVRLRVTAGFCTFTADGRQLSVVRGRLISRFCRHRRLQYIGRQGILHLCETCSGFRSSRRSVPE
jgi:hypothetical protein